jgi:hypothetical protein
VHFHFFLRDKIFIVAQPITALLLFTTTSYCVTAIAFLLAKANKFRRLESQENKAFVVSIH